MVHHLALQTIATLIGPYIGQMMARSSIEAHCKRLGIDGTNLRAGDIDRLLQQIALGLNVFIGREKTDAVMRDIRSRIGRTAQ